MLVKCTSLSLRSSSSPRRHLTFLVLSQPQVHQTKRGQYLRILRAEVNGFLVRLEGCLEVLLKAVDLSELQVRGVVALNVVGSFEAVDRLFVVLQVREAESLVMPYFPVLVSRGGEEVTSEELEIVVKE